MLLKQVTVCVRYGLAITNLRVGNFHKSAPALIDQGWRRKQRLTKNPNSFGPLTNMPDYSFKDGRPVPFGVRQLIRIKKQRIYLDEIKKLTSQIDYAVERHKMLTEKKAEEERQMIDNKLKPKGHLM